MAQVLLICQRLGTLDINIHIRFQLMGIFFMMNKFWCYEFVCYSYVMKSVDLSVKELGFFILQHEAALISSNSKLGFCGFRGTLK